MKLNLANRLTLLRVVMIPLFVVALMVWHDSLLAFIIFVFACMTDFLDGFVARKFNMITDFGKFLDPLADKILVISALICLVETMTIPAWIVIVIVAREFIISGFRLAVVAKNNKAVIAADIWGKIKTAATMVSICSFLLLSAFSPRLWQINDEGFLRTIYYYKLEDACFIFLYTCVFLTVFSGFTMIWKNRKLFSGE